MDEARKRGIVTTPVLVGLFPSAGSVHVYAALDGGAFSRVGLDVSLEFVESSDQQMRDWDTARYDVMHTSPDHLLRPGRQRDPVVVLGGGVGELTVYQSPESDLTAARWGVDGPDSAFALILRAIVEDVAGVAVSVESLVAVGGTKQRLEALLRGDIDGATLTPPYSQIAESEGLERLGSHLDVVPDYLSSVVVVERSAARSTWVRAYLQVLKASARGLASGEVDALAEVLERRGWDRDVALLAASGMQNASGLGATGAPTLESLVTVLSLRRRFFPNWEPARPLKSLLP